jgi:hypothetical protein
MPTKEMSAVVQMSAIVELNCFNERLLERGICAKFPLIPLTKETTVALALLTGVTFCRVQCMKS